MIVETLREQWARVVQLDQEISEIEGRINLWHRSSRASQRVAEIPGVGVLTATAVVSAMGDPAAFRSGREFAAWLGLVPRHKGTGGRVRLLGISKRGDKYLRTLLIHGARAVLSRAKAPPEWVVRLSARRPPTWSPLHWPTRRRAQCGPCWPTTGRTRRTSSVSRPRGAGKRKHKPRQEVAAERLRKVRQGAMAYRSDRDPPSLASPLGEKLTTGNEERIGRFHQGQRSEHTAPEAEYKTAICLPVAPKSILASGEASIQRVMAGSEAPASRKPPATATP